MKKIFIIILNPNSDTTLLRAKISEIGDYYNIYDNQYLVSLECDNAEELYNKLQTANTPPVGIVILGVSIEGLTYWGYSDKKLWSWLQSHLNI